MSIQLNIIDGIKKTLPLEHRQKLREFQKFKFRGVQHLLFQRFAGSNLRALAKIYKTDKWGSHWYAKHYETHFAYLRHKKLNILEIGIGGYDNPKAGGGSLRMWCTYFPKSKIFGIDIYDKSCHDQRKIKTFRGSQVDDAFLAQVLNEIGSVDIIIDDGSHLNEHIIHTFKFLFPRMSENGIYVIEDLQTSYWPSHGGTSDNFNSPNTAMGFLKQLTDGLNSMEYKIENYQPTYFDQHIKAINFYHNISFIQKGINS